MQPGQNNSFLVQVRRYLILGLFTLIPIWLTLLLLSVIVGLINDLAAPIINWMTAGVHPGESNYYTLVRAPWFRTSLSIVVLLVLLYASGWLASKWLGQRLLKLFDDTIQRIPVAKSIYNMIRRLADALQTTTGDVERVVLIEFPTKEMKTVGLVTRTFKDSQTGRELAAVYVPTTPNPTSGYLEIVPIENVVPTNWSLEEAMSFIISGGADVPDEFYFEKPHKQE